MEQCENYTRLFILQMFLEHFDDFSLDYKKACKHYFGEYKDFGIIYDLAVLYFLDFKFTQQELKQMIEQIFLGSSGEDLASNETDWEEYKVGVKEKEKFDDRQKK